MPSVIIGGIVACIVVTGVGVLYVLPPYLKAIASSQKVPDVLLSLSVTSDQNMPNWCQDITEYLNKNHVKAIVFFSGTIASEHPDCVRQFGSEMDIGSSTYSYVKLSTERDYIAQLQDVQKGKETVDSIAGIHSMAFKAPYGYTDDNIYSLLSRNNITADFSRDGSFNKYEGDKFILYDLKTLDIAASSSDVIANDIKDKVAGQIQITADNSTPAEKIISIIDAIRESHEASFVNASDLTGFTLTSRDQ